LSDWQQAANYYEQLLEMSASGTVTMDQHKMAKLGYCRCLIKLHRYSRVNTHLKDMYFIKGMKSTSADLWLLYEQARRKAGDYDSAKLWIQKAVALDPNNPNVQREQKVINLRDERKKITEHIKFNTRASSLDDQRPWYNILSIDGGGIRGVIPAIWLMELERQIKQPISSTFHVIAGTSTGAIIAAGLSAPFRAEPGNVPYQAYNLVNLYRTKAHKVFTRDSSRWAALKANYFQSPQYLDDGKLKLFQKFFGTLKLSNTLTELVVPAVKAESNVTDTFTTHRAKRDSSKNFLLRDVLMCTTAAPTFFPPYSIDNTTYVDGGVQANNPAMIAYSHAIKINQPNLDKNRIRLVSLGTGDYVPDPLHPTAGRDLLFWFRNRETVLKVLMDGPQNNIDMQLADIIGENYYRWQVWLENPIQLDDIQPASIERLIDLAYEQLEEMEAYDNSQRLGCLVDKLRSPYELPA
jgi:predicted patatin/cPLA2 family phospholipase